MSTAPLPETGAEAAARRWMRRRRLAPWLLMAPALAIVAIFFGLPTLYMARMSVNLHIDRRAFVPGLTFDHYAELIASPIYVDAIWTTVQVSVVAAIVTVLIGYGFALMVWLKPARWRLLLGSQASWAGCATPCTAW